MDLFRNHCLFTWSFLNLTTIALCNLCERHMCNQCWSSSRLFLKLHLPWDTTKHWNNFFECAVWYFASVCQCYTVCWYFGAACHAVPWFLLDINTRQLVLFVFFLFPLMGRFKSLTAFPSILWHGSGIITVASRIPRPVTETKNLYQPVVKYTPQLTHNQSTMHPLYSHSDLPTNRIDQASEKFSCWITAGDRTRLRCLGKEPEEK